MEAQAEGNRQAGSRAQCGFAYIAVLIFIAIMSVGLAATADVWHTELKRENEAQLLFVGDQFRNAMVMYYLHGPGAGNRYPATLQDLLKDPRYPQTTRYLRKIYNDPMTGTAKWGLLKGPNGELLGIHSLSDDAPIKKSNFSYADRAFEGKAKYSEWLFAIPVKFFPAQAAAASAPGASR